MLQCTSAGGEIPHSQTRGVWDCCSRRLPRACVTLPTKPPVPQGRIGARVTKWCAWQLPFREGCFPCDSQATGPSWGTISLHGASCSRRSCSSTAARQHGPACVVADGEFLPSSHFRLPAAAFRRDWRFEVGRGKIPWLSQALPH
jgi:hypothetical protein